MIIGGDGKGTLTPFSDIEAISFDEDNISEYGINCDPVDLPYKVKYHESVYTPALNGILTCGGMDKNQNRLSKCILQREGNDSNQFPALHSKRTGFSLASISDYIYAIGGIPNKNTMETINLTTDKQWKKEELPFSVSGHCSVGLGNKIIITGGYNVRMNISKIILKYFCIKQCKLW